MARLGWPALPIDEERRFEQIRIDLLYVEDHLLSTTYQNQWLTLLHILWSLFHLISFLNEDIKLKLRNSEGNLLVGVTAVPQRSLACIFLLPPFASFEDDSPKAKDAYLLFSTIEGFFVLFAFVRLRSSLSFFFFFISRRLDYALASDSIFHDLYKYHPKCLLTIYAWSASQVCLGDQ